MINTKDAQNMAKTFMEALPKSFSTLNQEMRLIIEKTMQDWLQKMDIVTREEFDVQTKVLQKTRAKLDDMEQKLHTILEGQHNPNR